MKFQKETIELLKEKKELQNLDDSIVEEKLLKYLIKNPKIKDKILKAEKDVEFSTFRKNKVYRDMLKKIRTHLRQIYGVFIDEKYVRRDEFLKKLEKSKHIDDYVQILKLHKSTFERLPYYHDIYPKIFAKIGMPKKIVDLACGLNPIGYPYLGINPEYFASDLNKNDCEFLNYFFRTMKIKGRAEAIDLTKREQWDDIPKGDVCFLFKALDSLETVQRNISRDLLPKIPCKWIVVSFPKVSLGSKKEIKPEKRNWLFRIIVKNGWEYSKFEVSNEMFVIIEKTSKI